MAQRVTANSRVGRPAPQKGGKPKPAPKSVVVPDFNNPGLKAPPPPRYKPPAPPRTGPPFKPPKPKPLGIQTRAPGNVPGTDAVTKETKTGKVKGDVVFTGTNQHVKPDQMRALKQRNQAAVNQQWADTIPKGSGEKMGGGGNGGFNAFNFMRSQNAPTPPLPAGRAIAPIGAVGKPVIEQLPNYTLGPNLTAALEGKQFSNWGLSLDAASLPGLPFLKLGGRTADVAEHIGQGLLKGEDAGAILNGARQVARQGKNPANRALHTLVGTYENPASRSRVLRGIQRTMDRMAQKAYTKSGGQLQGRISAPYVMHFVNTARFYSNNAERVIGDMVGAYRLSKPERAALEVAVHEVPVEQVIANKEHLLAAAEAGAHGTHPGDVKRLKDEIALLNRAKDHLTNVPAEAATGVFKSHLPAGTMKPVFNDMASQKLHHALQDVVTASQMREAMATNPALKDTLGFQPLTAEAAAERRSAPGRFHLGARWMHQYEPATADLNPGELIRIQGKYPGKLVKVNRDGQTAVVSMFRAGQGAKPIMRTVPINELEHSLPGRLVGHEDFNGGLGYIPSVAANKKWYQKTASWGGETLPRTVTGGSEFKHPWTGALEEGGLTVHHPTQQVGAALNQMQRMNAAAEELSRFREGGFKESEITQNLDKFGRPTIAKPGIGARGFVPVRVAKQLSTEAQIALQDMKNPQKMDELLHGLLTHSVEADPSELVFVPKALVGDMLKAPASNSQALKFLKDVSVLVKNFLVYTKFPGHIPPRLASNTTMAAIQQGAAMTVNVPAAIWISKHDPQVARIWDAAMGSKHAFTSFAQEEGHNITSKISQTLATPVIWTADVAPRRTALVHEIAQEVGHTMSVQQMAEWTRVHAFARPGTPEALAWRMVTQRARRAAGEYGRANSLERKIAPFVFLYQWGKVAVNITAKSVLEHPVRTGAILGSVGKFAFHPNNPAGEQFGVNVGKNKFANLTTSIPFSTPYEYGQDLYRTEQTAVQSHKAVFGEGIGQLANPAFVTMAELGLGYSPITGQSASGLQALESLAKQSPIGALIAGKAPLQDRIMKFLVGNEWPKTLTGVTPDLKSTLTTLVHQKKITQAEANSLNQQLTTLKNQIPGLEAKVKAQLDKAVAAGQITSKQESTALKRVDDTYANAVKRLAKAAKQ